MEQQLSRSASRVQHALASRGFDFQVVELPDSARTAQEAASAIGCEVREIAKSLVFRCIEDDSPLLVVASGSDRVDENKLSRAVGRTVKKADAAFVRDRLGFAIGGVAPVGHIAPVRTLVDAALLALDVIWAAAGTPHAVFKLTPRDLVAMTEGQVVDVAH